jgi:hypothetical protein
MDIQSNAADIPDLTPQSNFQTWTELYDAIKKRIEEIRGMCSISDTPENRAIRNNFDDSSMAMNYVTAKEYEKPPTKAGDPELEKEKERLAREAYRIAQTHVVVLRRKNPQLLPLLAEKADPFIGLSSIQEFCINAEKIMEGLKQVEDDPTNSQQRGKFGFHSKRDE